MQQKMWSADTVPGTGNLLDVPNVRHIIRTDPNTSGTAGGRVVKSIEDRHLQQAEQGGTPWL